MTVSTPPSRTDDELNGSPPGDQVSDPNDQVNDPSAQVNDPNDQVNDPSNLGDPGALIDPFAPSVAKIQFCLSLLQIFVVSLAIRICFNFATMHPNISFVGDASEYLREAAALATPVLHSAEFLKHAFEMLIGTATPQTIALVHSQTSVLEELRVAGPVFPLFLLGCFGLAEQTPSVEHWQLPVIVQCLMSSLMSVIIAVTARRAWNRTIGVTAGAIAAVYPSFIISTGSLYTETFTAFLYSCIACLSVSSIVSRPSGNFGCVLLGFLSAALQLTRPPAAILSVLMFPFIAWQRRSSGILIGLFSLVIGFAIILAPYVALQKVAFNTSSLIVNRRASENLFMGNSNQTQGWTSTPFCWMPPEKERTAYLVNKALSNPRQTAQLFVDKTIRLLKFPFNDYRIALGPFDFPKQILFHQLIIICAAIGLSLGLFTSPRVEIEHDEKQASHKSRIQGRLCLLMIGGSNLVYIAFVSMARYFDPSMPIVIMFAAAGSVTLFTCLKNKSYPLMMTTATAVTAILFSAQINFAVLLLKTGLLTSIFAAQTIDFSLRLVPLICLGGIVAILLRSTTSGARRVAYGATTLLLLLVLIPTVCLPSRANGRGLETTFVLNSPGQTLKQQIVIPSTLTGPAYLMLDVAGIKSLNGLDVYVNNSPVSPIFIPNLSIIPVAPTQRHEQENSFYLEAENLFHCLTLPSRTSISDLRQWFLIPVPQTILKGVAGHSTQTVNVELKKTNFATTVIYGKFARNKFDLMIPSVSGQSTEKAFYSVESPFHLADPRFDTRVKLLHNENQSAIKPGSSADSKALTGAIWNIRLLVSATTDDAISVSTNASNRSVVKIPDQQIDGGQRALVSVQPKLPTEKAAVALLRFHGKIKTLRGEPSPHVALEAFSQRLAGPARGYDSPWTPCKISSSSTWQEFNFTVPLPVADLPGTVQALNIWSSDGDPQQQLLRKPHTKSLFAIKDMTIDIFQLQKRPLEPGYTIY